MSLKTSHDLFISENRNNAKDLQSYVNNPARYRAEFKEYLERTSKMFLKFVSPDGVYIVPYKHRWEASYRKGILRKLYQLDIWAHRHHLTCGMLSLTSAQTGYTDIEILERFQDSWAKFQDNLNKMGFKVFKLYEPHESGLPHLHAVIIGDCSEENISRLESLWHDKYEMGVEGVDFDFSPGLRNNPVVESLVNYLMKYLSKTVTIDFLNDKSLMRFHSLFYFTRAHMFSCSRYLSYVMGKVKTSFIQVDSILIDENEIYNRTTSEAFPCKYQTIKKVKYKYRLLPFEIKSKLEREIYDPFVDNYGLRMWFERMEDWLINFDDLLLKIRSSI